MIDQAWYLCRLPDLVTVSVDDASADLVSVGAVVGAVLVAAFA
jgi:hypothetical protein